LLDKKIMENNKDIEPDGERNPSYEMDEKVNGTIDTVLSARSSESGGSIIDKVLGKMYIHDKTIKQNGRCEYTRCSVWCCCIFYIFLLLQPFHFLCKLCVEKFCRIGISSVLLIKKDGKYQLCTLHG